MANDHIAALVGTNAAGALLGPIGSVDDGTARRLQTQTLVANAGIAQALPVVANPYPANVSAANMLRQPLRNGSNASMMVVATLAAPVAFSFVAEATKTWVVTAIHFLMTAATIRVEGTYFANKSGGIANGMLIELQSGGITTQMPLIKVNEDFIAFNDPHAQLNADGTNDYLSSRVYLTQPLVMGTSDAVRVIMRDNMTTNSISSLFFLQAWVEGVRG